MDGRQRGNVSRQGMFYQSKKTSEIRGAGKKKVNTVFETGKDGIRGQRGTVEKKTEQKHV